MIHAWDVAHGGGLDTNLDPDIVRDLWARVEPHLDQMREMGAYGRGASGQLPPAAPLQTRLLDAFGRHPQ